MIMSDVSADNFFRWFSLQITMTGLSSRTSRHLFKKVTCHSLTFVCEIQVYMLTVSSDL